MELKILCKPDYAGRLTNAKLHTQLFYYTRKQIKSIYPNRNFIVLGEIGNKTGIQLDNALYFDGQYLPVYKEKTHNRLTEGVVGFVQADSHTYLAVVKNILLKRVLILALAIVLIYAGAVLVNTMVF